MEGVHRMESFESYLVAQELSMETIKKYLHDVSIFLLWAKENDESLNRQAACEWKNYLLSQNYAP